MTNNVLNNNAASVGMPLFKGLELGVEVGSLSTFFSRQNPALGKGVQSHRKEWVNEQGGPCFSTCVRMPDANIRIEELRTPLQRTLTVEALEDSWLMDAVLRYEIPLSLNPEVMLNERIIEWKRANKYHQVPSCEAFVRLKGSVSYKFSPLNYHGPEGLEFLTYLRDEPDRWILHFRARAGRPQKMSMRGCFRWFNKPFPLWVQALVSVWPAIGHKTLYLREKYTQRIPFQTNGAVRLKKGEKISFSVIESVELSRHD